MSRRRYPHRSHYGTTAAVSQLAAPRRDRAPESRKGRTPAAVSLLIFVFRLHEPCVLVVFAPPSVQKLAKFASTARLALLITQARKEKVLASTLARVERLLV